MCVCVCVQCVCMVSTREVSYYSVRLTFIVITMSEQVKDDHDYELTDISPGSGVLNPGECLKWEGLLSKELPSSSLWCSGEGGRDELYINWGGSD